MKVESQKSKVMALTINTNCCGINEIQRLKFVNLRIAFAHHYETAAQKHIKQKD